MINVTLVLPKCLMQLSNLIALPLTLFTICPQLCLGYEVFSIQAGCRRGPVLIE